jgi:hypothetical protein
LISCSTQQHAVDYFSAQASCPEARIVTRSVAPPPFTISAPPDDVLRDRERLEVWTTAQAAARARRADTLSSFDYYAMDGCGEHQVVVCNRPYRHGRRRVISCGPAAFDFLL